MAKGSFDSTDLIAPLMLRIPLGVIFMAHGSQKLLGLFGGQGLPGTFKTFEEKMGIQLRPQRLELAARAAASA